MLNDILGNNQARKEGRDLTVYLPKSIGIAAENYNGNFWLYVFPKELDTLSSGDVTEKKKLSGVTTDIFGNSTAYAATRSKLIHAEWRPLASADSNKVTAPYVSIGEEVLLYNIDGTDNWYWDSISNDISVRTREVVTHMYSNKDKPQSDDSVLGNWVTTIDTINKVASIITSSNDGEQTSYKAILNPGTGQALLTDGNENEIRLDTTKNTISIKANASLEINIISSTKTGTVIINTDTATLNVSKEAELNVGPIIAGKSTSPTTTIKADTTSVKVDTTDVSVNAKATAKVTSPEVEVTANTSFKVTSPQVEIKASGNCNIESSGPVVIKGTPCQIN
jgi:hypothetical protein